MLNVPLNVWLKMKSLEEWSAFGVAQVLHKLMYWMEAKEVGE
jgi:hypothetical protein